LDLRYLLPFLPFLAGPSLAQTPAPPPTGIVEQPCPPQIPLPPAVVAARAAAFEPGNKPAGAELLDAPGVREAMAAAIENAKTDWANLCHYRGKNAGLDSKPAPKAVFIGDSITEYWIEADPNFFGGEILDRGISGQTSQQILARFYQDVVALHPAAVHILAGTNDVAGNLGPSREQDVVNNISAMADIATANRIRVIIGAIPPAADFPWRPGLSPAAKIIALNAKLKAIAIRRGYVFVDYHSAMADPGGGMRDGLSSDGVHPNRPGYRLMEALAQTALAKKAR
jgi:lysophospholipase L1-like esterase